MKKLYKSATNRTISGVCGGIGEYFNIDPTIIRIILIAFVFFGGSGVIAYIVAALIIPNPPRYEDPIDHQPHDGNWGNGN